MSQAAYIYFSVLIIPFFFFSLNLFEVDTLMLTVRSSHSLPVQGANVIWQHHCLWRAPKMLIIKNTKCALACTFLHTPSWVLIFAQQMRHSPGRTGSSLVPAWLLSLCQHAGVIPRRVCQPLLAYLLAVGFQREFTPQKRCQSKAVGDPRSREACVVPEPPKWGYGLGFSPDYPYLLLNS